MGEGKRERKTYSVLYSDSILVRSNATMTTTKEKKSSINEQSFTTQ